MRKLLKMAMAEEPTLLSSAARCGAKTRRGAACQSPAVKGKRRCRMHGGTNPGPPKGNRNAYKHGRAYTNARTLIAAQTGVDPAIIPKEFIEAKMAVLLVKKEARQKR